MTLRNVRSCISGVRAAGTKRPWKVARSLEEAALPPSVRKGYAFPRSIPCSEGCASGGVAFGSKKPRTERHSLSARKAAEPRRYQREERGQAHLPDLELSQLSSHIVCTSFPRAKCKNFNESRGNTIISFAYRAHPFMQGFTQRLGCLKIQTLSNFLKHVIIG